MVFFEGTEVYDQLLQIKEGLKDEKEFLLRVGRFSGRDSITFDHRAKPDSPKTRNLADGKYPMGWIKCKIL